MPELRFEIVGAEAVPHAAAPLVAFRLRVTNRNACEVIHSAMIQAQIRIEPTRRKYTPDEQQRLFELFGEPSRWSQTLRSMLWTHATVLVPRFTGTTDVELPVPCSFDFNVAAAKYFYGVESGEVPLLVLFSGTVFYETADGALEVTPIAWNQEAPFRFPVATWKQMMAAYYPGSAVLSLGQDAFDRLYRYRIRRGFLTWDAALDSLLADEVSS